MTNTEEINERFSRNVDALIARRGLIAKKIAEDIGMTDATFSRKRNNVIAWTLTEACEIAQYFGVSLESLFSGRKQTFTDSAPDTYSMAEVESKLGKDRRYVLDLIRSGQLDAIQTKPNSRYLITRRSYEKFINAA